MVCLLDCLRGLMAMTLACRAGDPGPIPGVGVLLKELIYFIINNYFLFL